MKYTDEHYDGLPWRSVCDTLQCKVQISWYAKLLPTTIFHVYKFDKYRIFAV